MDNEPHKRRPAYGRAAFRVFMVLLGFGVWFGFIYPKSPLHDGWNPFTPLNIKDPFTPLTTWKLLNALGDTQSCLAALDTGASAERVEDHLETAQCHIRPQVRLSGVGSARLKPLNTRCQTALRIAMWERHGIQPAAQRHFGQSIEQINHLSSYNCRQIRTLQSGRTRMSTHATADAVDIAGFVTASGAQITLLKNWTGPAPEAAFLKDVRDSACTWFRVTLGPDYNALHADHFHLQHTGWGLCR